MTPSPYCRSRTLPVGLYRGQARPRGRNETLRTSLCSAMYVCLCMLYLMPWKPPHYPLIHSSYSRLHLTPTRSKALACPGQYKERHIPCLTSSSLVNDLLLLDAAALLVEVGQVASVLGLFVLVCGFLEFRLLLGRRAVEADRHLLAELCVDVFLLFPKRSITLEWFICH